MIFLNIFSDRCVRLHRPRECDRGHGSDVRAYDYHESGGGHRFHGDDGGGDHGLGGGGGHGRGSNLLPRTG